MKWLRPLRRVLFVVVLASLVAACTGDNPSPTAPAATATTAPTATSALTPTAPATPTQASVTPTTIPATPTPVPPELAVIAPDNAAGVQQVAQVGLGSLTHVSTSPDGKWLAVGSSQGIRLYDLGALDPVGEIATGPNAPRQIFFSPDGRTLAALMDGDESVHVWDLSSGQPGASPARTLTWTDRAAPVLYGVTFSPDWRVLAWVARGTVQLMDVATGQLLAGLGHEDFVQQIAFSPDGKLLATSFGGVKVWDVASGQELQTLIPYPDAIGASLTFSPDGATLVTASGEGTTKVWDVVSGQEHLTLTGVSASFSPDGEMLATTSGEGKVSVWNVKAALESGSPNAQVAATLDGDNPVFSPDGGTLAVKADETTIRLVDVASGQERQTLSQPAPVDSFEFLPDGNRLRVTLADQSVALWDTGATNGQPLWSLSGFMGPVQALAFSPDGKTLASGSTDRFDAGTIRVWELTGTSGAQTLAWRAHADAVQGLAYAQRQDGNTLASASLDTTVKLWDAATGAEVRTLSGHAAQVYGLAFSPDGTTVASASFDATAKLWDAASGQEMRTLEHAAGVWAVAFSPDGSLLASGSDDGTVKVWEVATGQERFTLAGNGSGVLGVAFSPDGQTLASGANDGAIVVWSLSDGSKVFELAHPNTIVSSVAFSPDGQVLASGAWDGSIKLWNAADGQELAAIGLPVQEVGGALRTVTVSSLAFSPDGRMLASAMSDGTVRLWGVANG